MKQAKHTPGPWQAMPEEVHRSYIRIRGTRLGGRFKIANVLMPTYENAHENEATETRANARLIAAAPDGLSAAIKALDECPELIGTPAGDALAAFIIKATGIAS